MAEKKIFNVNWFKPDRKGIMVRLSEKDLNEVDWWCRHYKDGISYLTYRMMQYFEAKDADDEKATEQLEGIIRACLPYYWEEVIDFET